MNFTDGSKHFDYHSGFSRGDVQTIQPHPQPLGLGSNDTQVVSHYVTSSTTASATSSQWGDAGQWHITRVIRLLSAPLGPRPCVSRARTPSSIRARGLPPSGPAGNRCRVLSRSCPAYVPCSCCDSTVLDCSRRCDGIERCATSSRAVLRPRADVSTSSSHSRPWPFLHSARFGDFKKIFW